MKHFRDLSASEMRTFINSDLDFTVKLDGSYFGIGVDELGFYTKMKGPKKFREPQDYSETYQYIFKTAHVIASKWFADVHTLLPSIVEISTELFGNKMPNSIRYSNAVYPYQCFMVITSNLDQYQPHIVRPIREYSTGARLLSSSNGVNITATVELQTWTILYGATNRYSLPHSIELLLRDTADLSAMADIPLNRTLPINVTKEEVLEARDAVKQIYEVLKELIRIDITEKYVGDDKRDTELTNEGIVIRYGDNQLVKLIHPQFRIFNTYYHMWQDRLIGSENSYKMFVGDKSKELNRLLEKYLRNPYTGREVHDRTLLLFAEERKRLDGRKSLE